MAYTTEAMAERLNAAETWLGEAMHSSFASPNQCQFADLFDESVPYPPRDHHPPHVTPEDIFWNCYRDESDVSPYTAVIVHGTTYAVCQRHWGLMQQVAMRTPSTHTPEPGHPHELAMHARMYRGVRRASCASCGPVHAKLRDNTWVCPNRLD